MEEFLPTLGEYKKKLNEKKRVATSVIQEKMKELHTLINKWEARFVDTARETLDEKIEALNQQVNTIFNFRSNFSLIIYFVKRMRVIKFVKTFKTTILSIKIPFYFISR